jgi:hypothetical protein
MFTYAGSLISPFEKGECRLPEVRRPAEGGSPFTPIWCSDDSPGKDLFLGAIAFIGSRFTEWIFIFFSLGEEKFSVAGAFA